MVILLAASLAAQKQPFDVQALLKIQRIQEPQLSPDGKMVAFTVQTVDLAQNAKPKHIYTVLVNGGAPRQITTQGTDNERPQWSPDSARIAFISDRGGRSGCWRGQFIRPRLQRFAGKHCGGPASHRLSYGDSPAIQHSKLEAAQERDGDDRPRHRAYRYDCDFYHGAAGRTE